MLVKKDYNNYNLSLRQNLLIVHQKPKKNFSLSLDYSCININGILGVPSGTPIYAVSFFGY